MLKDKIIGLLAIDSTEVDHFTTDDINLAMTFADQVSIALENARIFKETQDQAVIDHLTGIYNRRGMFLAGEEKFAFAMREERVFSCIMIDVDHFKRVNDTYGHDAGDKVLKELASNCKKCVREIDLVGRYGGEEIVILLPDAGLEASLIVAERVRATIENSPVRHNNLVLPITVSLGVACRDENTTTLDTLVKRADQAMYIAKHRGRNRVAFNK
jgi:diguanylate cyclase (GGDEF)-like protein